MSVRKKLVTVGLVGAALVLALSGCSNQAGDFAGVPEKVNQTGGSMDDGLQVFWLGNGARIGIAMWGSSGCPPVSTQLRVIKPQGEGNTVEAIVSEIPADRACTMDYVPHTSTFWTPGNVTTTEPLTVIVGDRQVVLPIK